jgi:hypothetical protein
MANANQQAFNDLAKNTRAEDFQLDTIGGMDFHFFPIMVDGTTATVQLHHNRLQYDQTYNVTFSEGVLLNQDGTSTALNWSFSTREDMPDASDGRLIVAADGSADFNTVQGAIDFLPEASDTPVEVLIRNGTYKELVFINGKSNLVLRGESRDGVVVGYPNNSAFNPGRPGPSRRPAFSLFKATDIQLSDFTIKNYFIGQAEALLVNGDRIILDHMTLDGSGDALTTSGSIYMVDSSLRGDGDTILAYATLFCLRCEISSVGPFVWPRTPEGQHGNIFVDSTFLYLDKPLPWTVTENTPEGTKTRGVLARLPFNGPREGPRESNSNFPHSEMVLINSKMEGVPPEGWGPIEDNSGDFSWDTIMLAEYNSTDLAGTPVSMSGRHPAVRRLTQEADSELIGNYRNPEWVFDGWSPEVK